MILDDLLPSNQLDSMSTEASAFDWEESELRLAGRRRNKYLRSRTWNGIQ